MLIEKLDLVFTGANQRRSKYDVIYPENDAKLPLLIFCHGFKGFKDWGHFPLICNQLAAAGQAVVKFNFSHNGLSIDSNYDFDDLNAFAENNYLKELQDINLLIDLLQKDQSLRDRIDFNNISILGHSRGGSTAILAGLSDPKIKRIITWAAVADLRERLPADPELDVWREKGVRYIPNGRTGQNMPMHYQFVDTLMTNLERLSIELQIKGSDKPLLIIHGEIDQAVPLEHAYALKVWQPNADLECIADAGHTFGGAHPFQGNELPLHTRKAVEVTLNFLKSHSGLRSG